MMTKEEIRIFSERFANDVSKSLEKSFSNIVDELKKGGASSREIREVSRDKIESITRRRNLTGGTDEALTMFEKAQMEEQAKADAVKAFQDAGDFSSDAYKAAIRELEAARKTTKGWEKDCRDLISANKELKEHSGFGGIAKDAEQFSESIRNVTGGVNSLYGELKRLNEPWAKADAAASKYVKTIGMAAKGMEALRKNTINNVVKSKIGINYNMSTEELLAAQQSYVQGTSRNISVSNSNQESLAAMEAVMGQGKGAELGTMFEHFGINLDKTAEHAGKMFSDASKAGISFEKYTDNVKKNIALAQNYTFKDGVKGLESMAKKATALNVNMQAVAGFADKLTSIEGGGVEGAIDAASKLQVLGGSFASLADPIGMLNEGLNDMEGLQDRVVKMTASLGHFDKATGEVKVSSYDRQRVKAAAAAMGMSYDDLMKQTTTQAKRGEIEKQIGASANASKLSNDMQEMIKNTATFKDGKAGVSINGEFKTLDQLQETDYEELQKQNQSESEDIKDIAKNVRSLVDIREGMGKQKDALQAKISEDLKTGEFEKGMLDGIAQSNFFLGSILALQAIGNIGNIAGGIGKIIDGFSRIGRQVGGFFTKKTTAAANMIKGGGLKSGLGSIGTKGKNVIGSLTKSVKSGTAFSKASSLFSKATQSFANITKGFGSTMGKVGTSFTKIGGKMSGILTKSTSLISKIPSVGTNVLKGAGSAISKVGSSVGKLATKASGGIIKGGVKQTAKRALIKTLGKEGAKKAMGIGAKLGKGLANPAAIIGTIGSIATDALVAKGKIKKGGAAHSAMKVGSSALAGAGMLSAFGPLGMALGAAGGAIIGGVKAAKAKNEVIVDNQLKASGIERKGNYSRKQLKEIDEALNSGKMSNKLRRKLAQEGDTDIINQIKKAKSEGEGKEGIKKEKTKLDYALFEVKHATIKAGNGGIFEKAKAKKRRGSIIGAMAGFAMGGPIGAIVGGVLGGRGPKIKGKPENGFNPEKISSIDKQRLKARGEWPSDDSNANGLPNGGKIDVNINGSIKLVGGDGMMVDITKYLLKDPTFVRDITEKIARQMNINENGTVVVGKSGAKPLQ